MISDGPGPCPQGWEYFHHSVKCYKLVKKSFRKMADAETYCRETSGNKVRGCKAASPPLTFANVQGYLVSIKNEKIGEFLYNKFKKKAWIGAKRQSFRPTFNKPMPIHKFLWSDNTTVEYTSWMSGEPNNFAEGCVINNFHQPKKWIDATCVLGPEVPDSNVPAGFFCEMDTVAAVVKGDRGEWPGHPKDAWAVQNLLKKNKKGVKEGKDKKGVFNYWLLPHGATNKGFILDFGFVKAFNLVQVVNTHSADWRDRATKKFKVYLR